MKKAIIFGFASLCLLLANQSFAQETFSDFFSKMAIKAAPQYEKADIQWTTSTKHDFGTITQGEAVVYEFQFTNTSAIPIKISNAHSSSDCVAPIWENKAIQPNEIATIRIQFCANQAGKFNKIIKVYIQDTKKAEALYIEGNIECD